MLGTVELITFAIQAAVQLAKAGRKVYVENTLGRQIGIPLPAGFKSDVGAAIEHAEAVETDDAPRYAAEFKEAYHGHFHGADAAAKRDADRRLIQLYLLDLGRGLVPCRTADCEALAGFAALHQWEPGEEPFPHPLQRVAGVLVEVAIDYCLAVPGALHEGSKQGRALKAFLQGLDDVDFEEERWDSIVVRLFTAALDTASEHPEILPGSERAQRLLTPILQGVAGDLQKQLESLPKEGDLDAEARIAAMGESVLRSLLRNAGSAVVRNPARLGVGSQAGRTMIQEVGTTFLDLLLPADPKGKSLAETLEAAFSGEGADRLLGSALAAVVEHPGSFPMGTPAVQPWLKEILAGLHENHRNGATFFDPDLYVEVANLVLEKGVRDLPLLLGASTGSKALFVEIARELYDVLVDPAAPGSPTRWKPGLARADVLTIVGAVLQSVANHTDWIERNSARRPAVAAALKFGVQVLQETGGLKTAARDGVLTVVMAAALQSGLLDLVSQKAAAGKAGARLAEILAAVEQWGQAGLPELLEKATLSDLLTAVTGSGIVDVLLGDDATRRKRGMAALVSVIEILRRGTVLSIPEMAGKLELS